MLHAASIAFCPLCETPCRVDAGVCDVCEQPLDQVPDIPALERERRIHGRRILASLAVMALGVALSALFTRAAFLLFVFPGSYFGVSVVRYREAGRRLRRARHPTTF